MASVAELKVLISASDGGSAVIKGFGNSLSGLEKTANGIGGALGTGLKVATGVAVAGGAAIAAGLAAGVKSAGDLQQSVANISTIAPTIDTTQVFSALNEMSTRVPQTASQLGDSLYDVFSSIGGLSQDAALQLVETFAKGATAAGTDAQTFGTAITGVLNAYKLDVSEAGNVSDEFFAIVRDGVVTGQELATSLGPVLQSAKAAGVGFKELGPLIAAVTKEGGPAAQNINNLNNFLSKLTTKDAAKGFKALGVSITDASGKFRDVPDILGDLKDALSDLTEAERANALQKIFPDLQARQGAQTLMSQLDFVKQALVDQANQVGLTEQAYKKMSSTFNSQSQILKNSVVAAFTAIGAAILPVITPLVTALAQKIPDVMKTAGASFKAFSVNLYAAGQGISTFGESLKNIPVLGQGFNRTFGILGSVVTGFAALLRGDGAGAIEAFGDAFSQTQQGLSEFGGFVDRTIGGVLNSVGKLLGIDVTGVGGSFEKLGTIFETVQGRVATAVGNILTEAGKLLGLTFTPDANSADKFSAIFDEIGRRFDGFKSDIGSKIDALTAEITKLKISDDVIQSFKTLGSTATQIASLATSMESLNTQTKSLAGFGVFAGALKVVSVGALGLAEALAQVVDTIGFLFDFMGTAASRTQRLGAAFAALATGDVAKFSDLLKQNETEAVNFSERTADFGRRFSERSHEISGSIQSLGGQIDALKPSIEGTITAVGSGFDAADAQVRRAADGINTSLNSTQTSAANAAASFDILPQAAAEAAAGFNAIPEAAQPAFEQLPAISDQGMQGVVAAVDSGTSTANATIQSGLEQMVSTFLSNFAETANAAELGMADTTAVTDAGMAQTVAAVETQAPQMTAAMDATGAAMTDSTATAMADVLTATTDGMAQVPPAVAAQEGPAGAAGSSVGGAISDGVLGQLAGLAGSAASAGAGMVSAFAAGVTSNIGRALSAARAMVQEIRDLLPGSDAETGPLSDLTASGAALPETLAKGVLKAAPNLTRVFRAVFPEAAKTAIDGFSNDLTAEFQKRFPPIAPPAATAMSNNLTAEFHRQFPAVATGAVVGLSNNLTAEFQKQFPETAQAASTSLSNDLTATFKQQFPTAAKTAVGGMSNDLTSEFNRQFPKTAQVAGTTLSNDLTSVFQQQFPPAVAKVTGGLSNDLTSVFNSLFPKSGEGGAVTTPIPEGSPLAIATDPASAAAASGLANSVGQITQQTGGLTAQQQTANDALRQYLESSGALESVRGSLGSVADSWRVVADSTDDARHALEKYIDTLNDMPDGGGGTEGRASGGLMAAGSQYLVGERGPELVTPLVSSYVTPNSQLGSAPAGTTIVINGDVYGYDDFANKVGGVINTVAARQSRERSRNLR